MPRAARPRSSALPAPRGLIARQPIFDRRRRVFGYELLCRDIVPDRFADQDPDRATSRVIVESMGQDGESGLAAGRPAFLNATRTALVQDHFTVLPPDRFIIEVLETVEPDDDVIAAVRRLKERGFRIALDDFVDSPRMLPLVRLADFIKVDFLATPRTELSELLKRHGDDHKRWIAEKLETHEEFALARDLGYHLFQGYFFARPVTVARRAMPGSKIRVLQVLREFHRPEMDFVRIESLFKQDVALAYRLLRYINSAHFGLRYPVSNIRQALLLLGEAELRKWVSLVAMAALADDKPEELYVQAIIRARFCEALGAAAGGENRGFLLGMFSLIDAMLDRPIVEVLEELPIDDEIKAALTGGDSPLRGIYDAALAYEQGEWVVVHGYASALGVTPEIVAGMYHEAVLWAEESLKVARTSETPSH